MESNVQEFNQIFYKIGFLIKVCEQESGEKISFMIIQIKLMIYFPLLKRRSVDGTCDCWKIYEK